VAEKEASRLWKREVTDGKSYLLTDFVQIKALDK
jgi:hypothetical protein